MCQSINKVDSSMEILSQHISHWHALLSSSVLKIVLQEQTCKLGHREKGKERGISDNWERLYCFLLCQGRITANAHWNGVWTWDFCPFPNHNLVAHIKFSQTWILRFCLSKIIKYAACFWNTQWTIIQNPSFIQLLRLFVSKPPVEAEMLQWCHL